MEFRQRKAIEKSYKEKLLKLYPTLNEGSGIYVLTRIDENGFKYAYIGQAKHILTRLAQHLNSHAQHIDNSLYKRKLYSYDNPYGWAIQFVNHEEDKLDEAEQIYIKEFSHGYQLYNKTAGSQSIGKVSIVENERKGYQKGLQNGYEKARKEVAKLFEKNLTYSINGKTGVNKEKAFEKFSEFIKR